MCDQQKLGPACAYAQSDQSICKSFEYSMSVKLLTEQHLEFLSLKRGCTGSFESTLVKMPHCWKSHATAQLFLTRCFLVLLHKQGGQSRDTHVVISHVLFSFFARFKVCFTIIFLLFDGFQKRHLVQSTQTRKLFLMAFKF